MKFLNRNKLFFGVSIICSIIVILSISVYLKQITIYEDLKIDFPNSSYVTSDFELVLVTPLGRKIYIEENECGKWSVSKICLTDIYIKTNTEQSDTSKLLVIINDEKFMLDSNSTIAHDNQRLIRVPFRSNKDFYKKLKFVFLSNIKFFRDNLLYAIGATLVIIISLIIIYKHVLHEKKFSSFFNEFILSFNKKKSKLVIKKPLVEIILFGILWLSIIFITIFKM